MSTTENPIHANQRTERERRPNQWSNAARLFRSEALLFLREPQVLVFVLGFPVLTALVLGGVFGTEPDDAFEFVKPSHFYTVAYFGVVLSAIGLLMLPVRVASYREQGVLRRYDTAGFARWVFPAVQYLCGVTFALLGFGALIAASQLSAGTPAIEDWGRTLVGIVAGTLAFISIGVALGMLYPSARAASGVGLTMFFPMFLLAGGGPPPESLTDTMRAIANWLPLTHVIRATQEPWLGLGDGSNHLVVAFAMFVVATGLWLWRARHVSRAA